MARYVEQEWKDQLGNMRDRAERLWDTAEALSHAAGYDYNDRKGRRIHPNPARQQGFVALAMQIYEKGLADGDYEAPFKPLV